jgi:hypothetical protein
MHTTITPSHTNHRQPTGSVDRSGRTAGIAALAFVAVVAVQNVIRGSGSPSNGASAEEVITHYADHRSLTFFLTSSFVVSGFALALFLGGVAKRLLTSARRASAAMGLVSAVAVLALFSIVVGCEVALSVISVGEQPDHGAVQALWALHNSVFTVNLLGVAMALVGLARAGVAAGVTPKVFDRLAPVGAGLLAIACAAGPAIAAGDAMPLLGLGLVGFLIWLGFLVTTGRRLVRSEVTA